MIRLFIGLALPETVRRQLLSLRTGIRGARWQRDDQLHLTLKFIGEVDEGAADDIDAALAVVAAPAFPMTLSGVGFFGPATTPRMVWAGVADKAPVTHLQSKIDAALMRIGLPPESRKFIPHVTLARLSGGHNGSAGTAVFMGINGGFHSEPFTVDAFVLYSSKLTSDGSYYTVEARYPLG